MSSLRLTAFINGRDDDPVIGSIPIHLPRNTVTHQIHDVTSTAYCTALQVNWDGDKVRGIRMEFSDKTSGEAGDMNGATVSTKTFVEGEKLVSCVLRNSHYGNNSLRRITLLGDHPFTMTINGSSFTIPPVTFIAGPDGYEKEVALDVKGSTLVGFTALVNPDNFINGLALIVRDPPPQVGHRYFEAPRSGKEKSGHSVVETLQTDPNIYVSSISVMADNDKVNGIRLTYSNGTTVSGGNCSQADVKTINMTAAESLVSVATYDGGWGHGSLRRIELHTNIQHIIAGPEGGDSCISPPVLGERIVGFWASVNQDNFINAFAFRFSSESPLEVKLVDKLSSYSPVWDAASGQIKFTGTNAVITIKELSTHLIYGFPRAVIINQGQPTEATVGWKGNTPLRVSVFNDGTFEAKFDYLYNSGCAKGVLGGLTPSHDPNILREALVLKYAPIYTLNWDEVYFQSNIDEFLPHMIALNHHKEPLTDNTNADCITSRAKLAAIAGELDKLGDNSKDRSWLRTQTDLNAMSDTQDWMNSRPDAPVVSYVVISEKDSNISFTYWFFFNYNQGKTQANTSWGNHVSDWEHVRVDLRDVNWSRPGCESLVGVAHNYHGDWIPVPAGDPRMEMSGFQVITHLANGDHEAYPNVGIYSRPMDTFDYCKTNGRMMDTRTGKVEIYQWSSFISFFTPPPPNAPARFLSIDWLLYKGRWGNPERGDLAGQVAVLENGPEGLYRPAEYIMPYVTPYPFLIMGTTASTTSTVTTHINTPQEEHKQSSHEQHVTHHHHEHHHHHHHPQHEHAKPTSHSTSPTSSSSVHPL